MRSRVGVVLLLFLGGCAGYKELEPDPPILSTERGYVELKKDAESFELEKEGKYFIKFPPPGNDHFFIIFSTRSRSVLRTSLTNMFEGDDASIARIPEADLSNDTLIVYPVDAGPVAYYWLIESVPYDLRLDLKYRYAPQWRFSFETKFAGYREVLEWYSVDRATYNSIDLSFDLDQFDLQRELASVDEKNSRISSMMEELLELEKIFPAGIAASRDTAYANYVEFRERVDEELTFQRLYREVLEMFRKERETRGNTADFLKEIPYYANTLAQRSRYTQGVLAKACQVMMPRLSEVAPSMDRILIGKNDLSKITPSQSVDSVRALYNACGATMPGETELILQFVNRFNVEIDGITESKAAFEGLRSYFYSMIQAPTDTFYSVLAQRADKLRNMVPRSQASGMRRFANYACAAMVGREVGNMTNMAIDLSTIFHGSQTISRQIRSGMWGPAESGLKDLFESPLVSYSSEVQSERQLIVGAFENDIFSAIKNASHARIDTFMVRHAGAIDNVPALYADSAFLPVYQLTFSSGGPAGLAEKRKQVDGYLDDIKHNQFPEGSIKSIYAALTRDLSDHGVEKARAIVEHGKFYQGTDNRVKNMIGECNVEVPKLISQPKEYRRFYALPVGSATQGESEYMFRLGLRIPSEAEFPVFDINIKLPEEITRKSGEKQWYESITINNKAIKNEGRFKITSPTAENNYEVLITPVQMDKGEKNILEVRFRYPGFRVFEVSAMAQVPIIRKN